MIYPNDSYEGLIAMETARTGDWGDFFADSTLKCSACGGDIYKGEDYIENSEGIYCRDCIVNMTSEDVCELLGVRFKIA